MLKQESNSTNRKIISLYFDSLEDLLNYIETTSPDTSYWKTLYSRETKDPRRNEFTGTKSLEEAIDLCRFSRKNQIENLYEIKNQIQFKTSNYTNSRRCSLDNYGFRPSVQKNIIGHPKQMYKIIRDESKKFININFDFTYPARVSDEQIYNRGILVLNLINLLETLNYRVNLNFFQMSSGENTLKEEILLTKINIKRFNEKLDSNICYFPMCHPSFVRRIMLAVCETLEFEEEVWKSKYGKPVDINTIKSILKPEKNDIIISGVNEIGIYGEDLIEDANRFFSSIQFNKYLKDGSDIVFDEVEQKFVLTKK